MKLDFSSVKRFPARTSAFIQKQPRYVLYGSGLIALGILLIIIGLIVL